jgi:hypothetical protein
MDPLEKLLQGVAAAMILLNKAIEKRSALECIVLQANVIDGALRVGLILKKQLDTASRDIDAPLLRQGDADPRISERTIYQRGLDAGVIDQPLFDRLALAYDKRNRCIHRYLLSDITYDFATNLVFELDALLNDMNAAIEKLEKAQIARGVGVTVAGGGITMDFVREFASAKEHVHNLDS